LEKEALSGQLQVSSSMAGPGRPGRLAATAAGFPPDAGAASPGFAGNLQTRLRPPDDLSREARAVFIDVVVNSNPEHFQPSDLPLLCVYADAVVQARACAKLIREGAGSDLVIKQQRNAFSAVFQLSMRLRVSPQARQVRKSLRSDTRGPRVSYFDQMAPMTTTTAPLSPVDHEALTRAVTIARRLRPDFDRRLARRAAMA
jgi:hypothetical protein